MKKELYDELFDFNIDNVKKVYSSNNEIYNQLILYIFFKCKKNILLVYPTLDEATEFYNKLKNYYDKILIFPEEDLIDSKYDTVSPELLYIRLELIKKINSEEPKIIIANYNSLVKKRANINEYTKNSIQIKKGSTLDRNKLIDNLIEIGYSKENLVTGISEFSMRGYVLDIYPIYEDLPYRLELFDDEVVSIKKFDVNTQLSNSNEFDSIQIMPIKENFNNNDCSLVDYINNGLIIYNNIEEMEKIEKLYESNFEVSNSLFKLCDLFKKNDIYINTIDNKKNYNLKIESKKIYISDINIDNFLDEIKINNGVLYTMDEELVLLCKEKDINCYKKHLNESFLYNDKYYYSSCDLKSKKKKYSISNISYGSKIKDISNINIGDYVVHRKSGIGIYCGIKVLEKNGFKKDYILIQYKGDDKLYLPVEDIDKLYKYSSNEGAKPKINKLNSIEWEKTKIRIKERIKSITGDLLKLYKERNKTIVEPYKKDDENQILFENEFEYEETRDQIIATNEIKHDLESTHPMERLLCGDVGYGKTEVIFRAIFKTIMNNKQVAYLCPTTVLCYQQYKSAIDRFKNYGIIIDIVNRQFTNKEVQQKLNRLKEGKIDIIFGTHRLLSNDVSFKNLGLLVIDEEHKFGVEQKEKIKSMKKGVHILSVSATPIPRSLQMSLTGIRDMSLLETPPKNRYPVQTYVLEYNDIVVRESIIKELSRKGQVFVLYNNISSITIVVNKLKKLIPEARICYIHGKMNKDEIQETILSFKEHEYDVLVSTTIIENGIDIPNANTMIVMDADKFGLSQLYQIRGRVGRGNKIAYSYFMYKRDKIISTIAKKRLDAIKEFTELGSGYKISMRDLSIRGAGDILGKEQAGFIDSIGVDMFLDLINEEIQGIDRDKEEIQNTGKQIDISTHIGNDYCEDNSLIIELHKKINSISTKDDLNKVEYEIKDRFGKIDEDLKLYLYEKYFEKLLQLTNINIFENNNLKIVFKLTEDTYKKINMEDTFIDVTKLSTKFNFVLKNNFILVSLIKSNLDQNYIYYCVKFLEIILDNFV